MASGQYLEVSLSFNQVLFSVDPKLTEALDSQFLSLLIWSRSDFVLHFDLFLLLTWKCDIRALNFKPFLNPPIIWVRDTLTAFLAAHEAGNFVKSKRLPWSLNDSGFDIFWDDIDWYKVSSISLNISIVLFPFLVVIATLYPALLVALMLDVACAMADFLGSLIFRALGGRCDMIVELVEKIEAMQLEVLLDLGLIVELELIEFLESIYQI